MRVVAADPAFVSGLVADELADLRGRDARPSAAPRPAWPAVAVRASRCARRRATRRRAAPVARRSSCRRPEGRRASPGHGRAAPDPTAGSASMTGRSGSVKPSGTRDRATSGRERRRAAEPTRVAGLGDVRRAPGGDLGDRRGDGAPRLWVPTLGDSGHLAVDAEEHERRQLGAARGRGRAPDRDRCRRGTRSTSGPRNSRRTGLVGGDDEVHPHVGTAELLEDARRGASGSTQLSLVYGSSTTLARWNVVSSSPSCAGLSAERREFEIERWIRRHGRRR